MFLPILTSLIFGALLGLERAIADKGAGMRTYSLVSMGSALFILISEEVIEKYTLSGNVDFDPLRMGAAIVTGIGFVGAGLFIFRENKVRNITTAAGLWVSSGIGIACGYGMYELAALVTGCTLFVFTILWFLEKKITKVSDRILH
ncbi:MAG: MgtC/SapB family protein [Candidatus Moraniibacteriota bacterium]|nr:MAG: MgtC/SapB family protein [Candidatus Moranbacteria bacterium]